MIGRQGNGLRLKVSLFPQVVGSFFFFEHCHSTSYLLTMVTWAGMGPSVCAHWTMADHCGHMGEQQARQTFGGKNEHFSGQAFRESTGLRARSMCFSTPGFQKTQPTCQGFQLSRSLLKTASSERERVEYLMEEEGKIYAGTHSKPRGRFFQMSS